MYKRECVERKVARVMKVVHKGDGWREVGDERMVWLWL